MKRRILAAAIVAAAFPYAASYAAVFNEAVDGDLSNNGLAPNALTLSAGSNSVRGGFGGSDRDYLALTVPVGHVLDAIVVGTDTVVGGIRSFIGVQAGPVVSVPPGTSTAAGLLGWTHFSFGEYGQDILDDIGQGSDGATGFVPPLSSGTYTFWIQDFDPSAGVFNFDFHVTAVPEPGVALTLVSGLALLGVVLRRRRR